MHQSWDQIGGFTFQIIERAHAFAFIAEYVDQVEGSQEDEVWYLFIDGIFHVLLEVVFVFFVFVYALMI